MNFISKIIDAPKPYGVEAYIINIMPMLLCFILIAIVVAMAVAYIKYKPQMIILKPIHVMVMAIHSAITMSAYGLLQYRWIVDQFEGDVTVEILWAVVESLFLLNMIWSIGSMAYSIFKYKDVEIENND